MKVLIVSANKVTRNNNREEKIANSAIIIIIDNLKFPSDFHINPNEIVLLIAYRMHLLIIIIKKISLTQTVSWKCE